MLSALSFIVATVSCVQLNANAHGPWLTEFQDYCPKTGCCVEDEEDKLLDQVEANMACIATNAANIEALITAFNSHRHGDSGDSDYHNTYIPNDQFLVVPVEKETTSDIADSELSPKY